jgi:hypothetical protein
VEQIQRPDVDRAAGEIDPGRSRGGDLHATIIVSPIERSANPSMSLP